MFREPISESCQASEHRILFASKSKRAKKEAVPVCKRVSVDGP